MNEDLHIICRRCDTKNRVPRDRLDAGPVCGACRAPLVEAEPFALTNAAFDRQSQGDLPLVVDFWAAWCAPCRAMAPAYEEAAARLAPRVRFAKVDTEAEPALAARFGIRGIPTIIAFHDGREVARQSGAMPLAQLIDWIERHVPQA